MMKTTALLAAIWCGMASAAMADPSALTKMTDEGRQVAALLLQRIRDDMRREIDFSGPLRAMAMCKYSAPEAAADISRKTGWRVGRVTLKPRNPALATPDSWEQQTLLDFDRRVAGGEKADLLERAEVVTEPGGRYFRYMKALPVAEPCLQCHGPAERMGDAVRSRLAAEYPHDKATGYGVGQVRGAITVKRPL